MPDSCGSIQSKQHDIGFFLIGDEEGLLAVARLQHAIAFAFEIVAEQRDESGLVFGNEDGGFQGHVALRSKGTVVELVVSALGRSIARWTPLTIR